MIVTYNILPMNVISMQLCSYGCVKYRLILLIEFRCHVSFLAERQKFLKFV